MRCSALLCYGVMAIIGQTNPLDALRQHIVTVYIFDNTRLLIDLLILKYMKYAEYWHRYTVYYNDIYFTSIICLYNSRPSHLRNFTIGVCLADMLVWVITIAGSAYLTTVHNLSHQVSTPNYLEHLSQPQYASPLTSTRCMSILF